MDEANRRSADWFPADGCRAEAAFTPGGIDPGSSFFDLDHVASDVDGDGFEGPARHYHLPDDVQGPYFTGSSVRVAGPSDVTIGSSTGRTARSRATQIVFENG